MTLTGQTELYASAFHWFLWLFSFALPGLAVGCTSGHWNASARTGTRITPDYFQFAEIVPEKEKGGWRAVCIVASVGQRIASPQGVHIDSQSKCSIEIGVPISNDDLGYIPLEMAQRISAEVANDVAYNVLENTTGPVAVICRHIVTKMQRDLWLVIEGSRVNMCGTTKWRRPVPVVHWP